MAKLKNVITRARNGWKDTLDFGLFVGWTNMLWPVIAYMPNSIRKAIMSRKKRIIEKHIQTCCQETISKYSNTSSAIVPKTEVSQIPIFVCWLQGESNAPDIVKRCVKSIRKHAKSHPVYLVNAENYSQYITLPDNISRAWQNKQISNAHFADVLRCALLCEHGGCWIDATIWMSGDIHDEVFEYPFYSCRFNDDGRYVTRNIWSNFFIAAQKHSITAHFVRDMLYEYMAHQKRFVDYFLMDYIIRWGYDNIAEIRDELNAIPMNNESVHELVKCVGEPMSSLDVQKVLGQSYVHKLSWRINLENLPEGSVGKSL
jgi:Capsular polysaccharide synthesis protein.